MELLVVSAFAGLFAIASGLAAPAFGAETEVVSLWDVLARTSQAPTTATTRVPSPTPGVADAYPLRRIAALPNANFHLLSFGDTDRDGFNEVIFWWKEYLPPITNLHYRIMEEQGQNVYSTEHVGPSFIPMATGDLDQDGRSEIIGQLGGQIQVYESLSPSTYPTELVWSSPVLTNVVSITAVGDTDRDGRMEIIHSENSFSGRGNVLHIYENVGDNSYEEVFATRIPDGGVGTKVIADFDRDGLIEIGFYSGHSVYMFESPDNNTWILAWSDSTELPPLSDADGGIDTDGNGRPELFVTSSGPEGWTTTVFEAVCNNTFQRITSFAQYDGSTGVPFNALANLDGVAGPVSFLMDGENGFWIYQPVAEGRWELVVQLLDPDEAWHGGLYAADVNRNGRDEVFWITESVFGHETLVLEKPIETAVDPRAAVSARRFTIAPNPILTTAVIQLPTALAAPGTQLAVYDVSGRLVQRWLHACGPDGKWTWPLGIVSSGVYFVRLEDDQGRILAATRATVLR